MKIRLNFIKIQIVMNLQVHYLSLKINLMQLKFSNIVTKYFFRV